MEYHVPVLLEESIDGLSIAEGGTYLDLTFGGGGHSRLILERLNGGQLIGFDQDEDAEVNARQIEDERFKLVASNFRHLKKYLRLYNIKMVNGILADLGVSSHQFDEPARGFSTRFDSRLDMRMSQSGPRSAWEVVNEYSEKQLQSILGGYGEVRNAATAARAIVAARTTQPINTVEELKDILRSLVRGGNPHKYFAQVFQAIRIEVNDELKALEEMLEQAGELLIEGGRLVVISYHSLEDRLVKNFINKGNVKGEEHKDFYGNLLRPLQPINRKPIVPSIEEITANPRARSAKLRVAEKI